MRYTLSNVTSKVGFNYTKSIVEKAGCLFQKIDQENDLGIDAIIEFIENDEPLCSSIAIQIKSGDSYYNSTNDEISFPVEGHYSYWLNYSLPVIGVVYVPQKQKAFWVDIKRYLKHYGEVKCISFIGNRANIFSNEEFKRIFMPLMLDRNPLLSFEDALSFFKSSICSESKIGSSALFNEYHNRKDTWDAFIDYINKIPSGDIDQTIVYYLAHIPHHPDIWIRFSIDTTVKEYTLARLKKLEKPFIIKLLEVVDESDISRGSIGQSVEAIISVIDNRINYLTEIALMNDLPTHIIENACIILAYYTGEKCISTIKRVNKRLDISLTLLIEHLNKYESYNPYE